jgi:hypothetical protein
MHKTLPQVLFDGIIGYINQRVMCHKRYGEESLALRQIQKNRLIAVFLYLAWSALS